jgi:hypothetical protein
MDDEILIFQNNEELFRGWLSQGRWSSAVISLLTPAIIVPVLVIALGLIGITLSIWFFSLCVLGMNKSNSLLLTLFSISIPTLTFTLNFRSLSFGLAFSSILTTYLAIKVKNGVSIFRYIPLGAFVIGIYDSSLILILLALAYLVFENKLRFTILILFVLSSTLVSQAILFFLKSSLRVQTSNYTSQFFDTRNILEDPIGALLRSAYKFIEILSLPQSKFGLNSYFLLITFSILVLLNLIFFENLKIYLMKIFIIVLPVVVGVFVPNIPIRSMYYLPIYSIILSGIFIKEFQLQIDRKKLVVRFFFFLLLITILNNSIVVSRLGQISSYTSQFDTHLTQLISQRLYEAGYAQNIRVHGKIASTNSPLSLGEPESIGNSVFSSENVYRVSLFLKYYGLNLIPAPNSLDDLKVFKGMSSYPLGAWLRIESDTLYLKFSP